MEDTRAQERAKQRVEDLKGLYWHIGVYVAINLMLIVINLVSAPDTLWFYWVTLFWGIGLSLHIASFMLDRKLGGNWEKKKLDQYLREEQEK